MAEFNELIETVTDEATKTALKEAFDKVNRERGEFGQKLILKDKELNEVKSSSVEYKKAYKILAESGTKAEDIPALLEKMKVVKTVSDEYELTKTLLKTKTEELQEKTAKLDRLEKEGVLKFKIEKARAEFKDDKGKPVKLADDFIDFDKLYSGITDLSNEAVLTEKINLALKSGHEKQSSLLGKLGFQGVPVHKAGEGDTNNISQEDLNAEARKISKEQGPAAAISFLREAAKNKNKG